ncbi:MAG: hypothetical protein A3J66_04185 [Candidatus Magasanikbacteria bacterium RIFCSPHIGHO2_02_FULL_47_14]|uniref:Thioredoxin domain-containing protein n=1 Tax=Candidatus Magasanikbacteria bacterium RIFCSPHIGHO2_02_FULL_47_14 TaxID=1798680 RepID=A0A1F6M3I6_9BACT|nr:MAG: hypothetical protein A3J66_04185 [Candidatus Magasanikbacteria bacterium RIFCSPHIGHO2_02_FULL_47_14]
MSYFKEFFSMTYFHAIAKAGAVISLVLLVGGGCTSRQQTEVSVNSQPQQVEVETQSSGGGGNTAKMEVNVTGGVTNEAGSYEAYAPEKIAQAAAQGKVVLFFHAPWCPTCKAVNSDIEVNRASIPAGVTILKVDYDSSTALKQKYGVTYQHTFVQVDAEGNMIKKWSGGLTLDDVLSNI